MPFRLDLLRHGAAAPADARGDAARILSAAGRRDVERVAAMYAKNGWRPAALLSSPLQRARETADILARALPGVPTEVLEELTPEREPEDVLAVLAARPPAAHLVLVGHQPLLGRLAAWLAGGGEPGLPPAGLLWISFPDTPARGEGTLEAALDPA